VRVALFLVALSSVAHADGLAGLYDRVAADLKRGQPLVVEAHVALCDNRIIPCGNRALGDGESLATNLYWATDGGLRGWFERRGSGWTRVAVLDGAPPGVLEEDRPRARHLRRRSLRHRRAHHHRRGAHAARRGRGARGGVRRP